LGKPILWTYHLARDPKLTKLQMARSKRNLNDSRGDSPDSADDTSPMRSPVQEPTRGRQGKHLQEEVNAQVASEMK
jgi:hypothetical protein